MKPIRIEAHRIVFAAVLDNDVPTIPAAMDTAATKLAQRIGRTISDVEGNWDEVWFYFNRDITEDEAELLTQ